AVFSLAGGAAGLTTASREPYGALPGGAGVSRLITPADLTTGTSGALCLPELTITQTTSTPLVTRTAAGAIATSPITVANAAGRSPATNVTIDDALPPGFTFRETISMMLAGGATRPVMAFPAAGSAAPAWGEFTLPGGASVTIRLSVDVAATVAIGAYRNSAGATYLDPRRTAVGGTAATPRASVDVAVVVPQLVAHKRDRLAIDQNGNRLVDPGDTLEYTVTISNTGGAAALGLTFTDTLDANTALVVGSVAIIPAGAAVTSGNTAGDTGVAVTLGTLAPGASVTVAFQARVSSPLPPGVAEVLNQGLVQGSNAPDARTDDPDTIMTGDPTLTPILPRPSAIMLSSFAAAWDGGGMMVRWATGMEYQTRGFLLYRSADRSRAHAVLVTPQLIPSQGHGLAGYTYEWRDPGAPAGGVASYWLAEVELDGTVTEYGPAMVAAPLLDAQHRVALPLVFR
ncbi:MAG: DUF11 domain-containing protein, partial [Chloroflexales bacterium]|nr:DUF11 domain-containing protein [Chloroflexales bacterium]